MIIDQIGCNVIFLLPINHNCDKIGKRYSESKWKNKHSSVCMRWCVLSSLLEWSLINLTLLTTRAAVSGKCPVSSGKLLQAQWSHILPARSVWSQTVLSLHTSKHLSFDVMHKKYMLFPYCLWASAFELERKVYLFKCYCESSRVVINI